MGKVWGTVIRWVFPETKATGLMQELKAKHSGMQNFATLEGDRNLCISASIPLNSVAL
jgi:hypothetical protein